MDEDLFNLDELNVLIVEDNLSMRTLIESVLFGLGIKHIQSFEDAQKAYRALQHYPADVVITDWNMKPVDGIQLVRQIRNGDDSPNPYIPVIMLTGHSEARRVVEARDAGVNEFLVKPVSAKAIYTRIASLIRNPRPFIRTKTYFGPCRRRKNMGPPKGMQERRREELERISEAEGISLDELREMMGS